MAPIKIQHIVSFSSQDPKHPVDNLLTDDHIQPWLSCPRDRSRQLKVELQLEHACHIAYIDVGNSGSAFFQIDVGRSSWPLDKPFVTLLPTATLMSPADSRLRKNARGVRMFKQSDFLAEAADERWDRLRITCSQPFNKQEQFGLCFLRIRSAMDEEEQSHTKGAVLHQGGEVAALGGAPPERLKTEEDSGTWNPIEEKLKEKLHQAMSPARSPVLSRTARMLLTATKSRKRPLPPGRSPTPPIPLHPGGSSNQQDGSPVSSGSCPETSVTPGRPSPNERGKQVGRGRPSSERGNQVGRGRRKSGRTRGRGRRPSDPQRRGADSPGDAQRLLEAETGLSCCPICSEYYPADFLPAHASSCGEISEPPHVLLSSSDDDDSWDDLQQSYEAPSSWVTCPLCSFRFRSEEIESHASTCGE
ncbi:protein XNDC1N isoform X3 [Hyperolius riggenbachi]|uniref:protein XNDC1N isoform X3 n=1 Tax=Hyperolius riggenbachi TaxID=752182 RepID=UPI0035A35C3C